MGTSGLWMQGELWLASGFREDVSDDLGMFPTGLAELLPAVFGFCGGDAEEKSAGGLGVKEGMVVRVGLEVGVVGDYGALLLVLGMERAEDLVLGAFDSAF